MSHKQNDVLLESLREMCEEYNIHLRNHPAMELLKVSAQKKTPEIVRNWADSRIKYWMGVLEEAHDPFLIESSLYAIRSIVDKAYEELHRMNSNGLGGLLNG